MESQTATCCWYGSEVNHEPPAMENMPFARGVACICQLVGFQSILVSELDGFMIRLTSFDKASRRDATK